jgi:hypothetical protein
MTEIFGNRLSQSQILEAVRTEAVIRTVLLSGPSYVGKRSFAARALGAHVEEADLLEVDHSVAGSREAVAFCRSAPVFSPYRAVLVDGSDQLSDAAQDAYLRLCEEPPPSSRVFLVAEDGGNMAPALLSRMERVTRWKALDGDDMGRFTGSQPGAEDAEAVRLCAGRPGLYLAMVGKSEYSDLYRRTVRRLDGTDSDPMPSVPEAVASLKPGPSPERDAVALVCRQAALSLVGRPALLPRIRRLLQFCSLIAKVPSANAEVHWQGTVFWTPV